jgi:hypothetical protein
LLGYTRPNCLSEIKGEAFNGLASLFYCG